MKPGSQLRNQIRAIRTRLGLSQQELATAAGIARQTVGGIEAELYAPSAAVALLLARALGCRVEELFQLDDEGTLIDASPADGWTGEPGQPVALARVGEKWIAHPLVGERAFRSEMVPADGVAAAEGAETISVRLLDDADALARAVTVAGCTPALSLWARSAERWHPGLRVHWFHANSMSALRSLARGEVHAAGVHLYDAASDTFNAPFVRQALPDQDVVLVNLGQWEEGFAVRRGNPMGIQTAADLAQPGVGVVNREEGAGSRLLLDTLLAADRVPQSSVAGYDLIAHSHQEVAARVASGDVDAGPTTAAIAAIYGLSFVPQKNVRYDLAVLERSLHHEPVQQLLGTLEHRRVRRQLAALGRHDTSSTGEIMRV